MLLIVLPMNLQHIRAFLKRMENAIEFGDIPETEQNADSAGCFSRGRVSFNQNRFMITVGTPLELAQRGGDVAEDGLGVRRGRETVARNVSQCRCGHEELLRRPGRRRPHGILYVANKVNTEMRTVDY